VFYVLQSPSLTDLAVVDHECTKAGLPRPVLPVAVGPLQEPAGFFYLTPDPDWLGRQDKRGAPPTLSAWSRPEPACRRRRADHSGQRVLGPDPGQRIQPVEAAVRRQLGGHRAPAPAAEHLILGRKTRVQFSAPIHLRELIGTTKATSAPCAWPSA
jgi:glycerol-3-phosphate O-acyltransferase